jgi:hypothetical protein
MMQRVLIAIGAGFAAALLFVVPIKGTALAMVVAFVAALPIMIAGLGFGHLTGLAAGVLGAIAISFALHPLFGALFAISLAGPAWFLSRLAALFRPDDSTPPKIFWYPVGRLLGWIVVLSAASTLALIGLVSLRIGGYGLFIDQAAQRLAPALDAIGGLSSLPGGYSNEDLARMIVSAMPPAMAAWTVVSLSINLWLAGRTVKISQLLARTWEDLPDHLALPPVALVVLAAALAACLVEGAPRLFGATIAAALITAYAFQGLAILHSLTRRSSARMPILMGAYFALLAIAPWPLAFAAIIGVIDAFHPIRRASSQPPTISKV